MKRDKEKEREIIRRMVADLDAVGWKPVRTGFGADYSNTPTANGVIRAAFDFDDVTVIFKHAETGRLAWVSLIFGNSPEELIADYSGSASNGFVEMMRAVTQWADRDALGTPAEDVTP